MRDAALPIVLIVIGALWLAWHFGWVPDIDWIVAGGLALGGVAVMLFDGVTKSSVVIGPFMIGCGIAWAVHDRTRTSWSVLIPALLILLGVVMLIARDPRIPVRREKAPPMEQ